LTPGAAPDPNEGKRRRPGWSDEFLAKLLSKIA
jgi:hypothetical protein